MPVFRNMTHIPVSFSYAEVGYILTAQSYLPFRNRLKARKSVHKLGLPVSVDSCNADNLTFTHLKRNVVYRIFLVYFAGHGHILNIQNNISRLGFILVNNEFNISSHHHSGKFSLCCVFHINGADIFAFSEDSTSVSHFHDFV